MEIALRVMLWVQIGLITIFQVTEIFTNPWAEKHLDEDKLTLYRTIWKAIWALMIAYGLILVGLAITSLSK